MIKFSDRVLRDFSNRAENREQVKRESEGMAFLKGPPIFNDEKLRNCVFH